MRSYQPQKSDTDCGLLHECIVTTYLYSTNTQSFYIYSIIQLHVFHFIMQQFMYNTDYANYDTPFN